MVLRVGAAYERLAGTANVATPLENS